jgi:hypothetical protein
VIHYDAALLALAVAVVVYVTAFGAHFPWHGLPHPALTSRPPSAAGAFGPAASVVKSGGRWAADGLRRSSQEGSQPRVLATSRSVPSCGSRETHHTKPGPILWKPQFDAGRHTEAFSIKRLVALPTLCGG